MDQLGLQSHVLEFFEKVIEEKRLSHAYLFEGDRGSGLDVVAKYLSQMIFCEHPDEHGRPDLTCRICQRIEHDDFPSVAWLKNSGESIKVNQIRDLQSQVVMKGMEGNRRIFIIENADLMTIPAANALLKFIEEPQGQIIFFLLTSQIQSILPTIQSRCQLISLRNPSPSLLASYYQIQGVNPVQSRALAILAKDERHAQSLKESELFPILLDLGPKWAETLLRQREQAFTMVVTDLQALVNDALFGPLILDYLQAYYKDLLTLITMGEEADLLFPEQKKTYQSLVEEPKINQVYLIQAMDQVNMSKVYHSANVRLQATLERLALKILAI